ncbi:hypothetical protein M8J76_017179 [Diaphorina citri]|nr:hypothetical protein M8J76_017179 [Diaphorina citri]
MRSHSGTEGSCWVWNAASLRDRRALLGMECGLTQGQKGASGYGMRPHSGTEGRFWVWNAASLRDRKELLGMECGLTQGQKGASGYGIRPHSGTEGSCWIWNTAWECIWVWIDNFTQSLVPILARAARAFVLSGRSRIRPIERIPPEWSRSRRTEGDEEGDKQGQVGDNIHGELAVGVLFENSRVLG